MIFAAHFGRKTAASNLAVAIVHLNYCARFSSQTALTKIISTKGEF